MNPKHNPPQRNSMMPAPANPPPQPDTQASGPLRTAYVADRVGNGWRLRICEIPESVVNAHTVVDYEPDVYAITSSKMGGHLDSRAMKGEP